MENDNSDSKFNKANSDTLRTEELLKDREAIKRALDYYLDPPAQYTEKPRRPSTMFLVSPDSDTPEKANGASGFFIAVRGAAG